MAVQQHALALPKGFELDGYRINSVLGSGGFGITYLANQISIKRKVAIKEYLPGGLATRAKDEVSVGPISDDDQADYEYGLKRFREEATTLVAIEHPNIVAIHDFREANGTAYLVMQYAEGESLQAILQRDKTLPENEIKEIIDPILDGLEAIHEAGFLHRDIKPGNIVIRKDGVPILIDFGAARQALGEKSMSLTAIVTPGYAPFEQYESRGKQGPWTDIYSVGAVLYRCVTGEKPADALDRTRHDPYVAVQKLAPEGYSAALCEAIDKALMVEISERPQDIAEWRKLLLSIGSFPNNKTVHQKSSAHGIGGAIDETVWEAFAKYYPEIETLWTDLAKLGDEQAQEFKRRLLATQDPELASEIAAEIRSDHIERERVSELEKKAAKLKYPDNPDLQAGYELACKLGAGAADEYVKAVNIFGENANVKRILLQLNDETGSIRYLKNGKLGIFDMHGDRVAGSLDYADVETARAALEFLVG